MSIKNALILAALILGLAWLAALAVGHEIITAATSERVLGAGMGLVLAAFGNVMPKTLRPLSDQRCGPTRAQFYRRFAGRTFVLAGLGYSLVQLTFPIPLARPVSMSLVAAAIVVVVAVCLLAPRKPESPAQS